MTSLRSSTPRLAIVAAYAAMVFIWGTTWLAIKYSMLGLPPLTGCGVRFLVAGTLMLLLAVALRIDLRRNWPPFHLLVVLAVTMFGLNYALTYLAETRLPSGMVAVIFGTQPFFTFAFAFLLVGETIGAATVAGALLAFGGVALISLGGALRGDLFAMIQTLLAALISGFSIVYLKKHALREPLATLAPAMLLAGAGLTLCGALFEAPVWRAGLDSVPLAALLYLAVFGSAIAFYL